LFTDTSLQKLQAAGALQTDETIREKEHEKSRGRESVRAEVVIVSEKEKGIGSSHPSEIIEEIGTKIENVRRKESEKKKASERRKESEKRKESEIGMAKGSDQGPGNGRSEIAMIDGTGPDQGQDLVSVQKSNLCRLVQDVITVHRIAIVGAEVQLQKGLTVRMTLLPKSNF
jgi:hypothetical protein